MTKVLIFTDNIPYCEFAKMSNRELFAHAREYERMEEPQAKIVDLAEFQSMYNLGEIGTKDNYIFFVETEIFNVNVIGYNAETFENNYELFIDSKEELYFDSMEYTLIAPIEVKEEIEQLTEELIEIV